MPEDWDREVYKQPPTRTPVVQQQPYNPIGLFEKCFYYGVDRPVTYFRDWMSRQHAKHKFYYYHRQYRRVPYISECFENDVLCIFEAEMQFVRDRKVDREIVRIIQDRFKVCQYREGEAYLQNCAKELQQFMDVAKAFELRYADLDMYRGARQCLMKQKHRMIEERKQAQAEANKH
ncbi:NADH dehydrogenase [ubiquinone] 1 beta subcomplex subunit 10 [Alligator mississippiensis]|uniref:NADH dehydrogenase [ubiquinone] 1 beta subcomplex subunit 10 n=1 Tax=Alligator mississippiensis TaxID=8496 RepID=A0A151N2H1_ALLMI|nr:NADH dehydrogenase [ubiquinone] 1 beta subcomplex subunit 10 [Alligator mississippiensis]KYO30839.1 NADH dehydrogenase [ubiquinone] 1 beta subcomplex subunit 10 [Alligator mississippiensis]